MILLTSRSATHVKGPSSHSCHIPKALRSLLCSRSEAQSVGVQLPPQHLRLAKYNVTGTLGRGRGTGGTVCCSFLTLESRLVKAQFQQLGRRGLQSPFSSWVTSPITSLLFPHLSTEIIILINHSNNHLLSGWPGLGKALNPAVTC